MREGAFANVDADRPGSTMSMRDFECKCSNCNSNETGVDVASVASSTNRIAEPLAGQTELEEPNSEDFNGWTLHPVDGSSSSDEQVAPFDGGSSTKVPSVQLTITKYDYFS